ncbi:hypothetical protein [Sulfurospirillum multivorans]|uniref:Uncharacterized protein n=2 Tax=Sulfurospirillum multivorans TaxID=66821 RepID=A0AA86AMS6_SULMK|nr:hypothetical protein [Sulfurospirillum multivorans]AHJ13144.1 hypothetical protein SMUL_1889 [Sulfurospirillum multivorans DSM 12446]QEH06632.1 hypothetical protein SMN_1867 [Sulfurospirillum multivorans]
MPIISLEATKKAKAIAYAVNVMQKEETFNTGDQGPMQEMFYTGGYTLKNDSPRSRLQVSSSVLYKHWKSGKEPKIYRKLISTYRGLNAIYSLTHTDQFKTYKESL